MIPKQEIGVATVEYDEQGTMTLAVFQATMSVNALPVFELEDTARATTDVDKLQNKADTIMAAWFSKMNEIELADREEMQVGSEIVECTKWPSGFTRKCVMRFVFQQTQQETRM